MSLFRKLENIECKEIILSENADEIPFQKDVLCKTSITNISKSPQPSQMENCIKSKCKVNNVHLKPSNTKILSAVESSKIINPQLASEQYINIFNRYQVF